jgi:serine/threonine protein phosphatase PrpC
MPPAVPRFSSAALSDQGLVRPNNEDRVYCDNDRAFFLVVDGMGGHEAGEQAAEIAVERIRGRLERQTGSAAQRLREAIALANNAIFEAARQNPAWNGMACVLTAALIDDGQVTVGHVGDSRLYKIKRGVFEKITHDHSPVGEREDSGELTEEQAMQHPRRNEVYRDVGSQEHTPDDEDFIEIAAFPFEPDSAFLLCSDGLSDALSSETIQRIVEQNAGDPSETVRVLIRAANEVGHDNVSAVLVENAAFAASFGKRARKRRKAAATPESSTGETTDRLSVAQAAPPLPWYRSSPAYLFYGVLFGALILFSLQKLLAPAKREHSPRVLTVAAPSTIAAALAKAQPGDTVAVAPGMYSEVLHLKDGITLVAQQSHDAIIKGAVYADSLRRARLEGFQIRGGETAIRIHDSNVVLASDDIAESHSAGVEFSGRSRGEIFACNVHNNAGPGILLTDTAAPVIEHNLILQNGAQPGSLRPGILVRSSGRPLISANIFAGNGAEPLWLPATEESIVQRNAFALDGKPDERPKFRIVPLQEGRP